MSSTANVLVKLKEKGVSLSDDRTGWSISCDQEKRTPAKHSDRISSWLNSGALVRIDGKGTEVAPSPYKEMLDVKVAGNRDALVNIAESMNEMTVSDDGPDVDMIDTENATATDLKKAISNWKAQVKALEA